MEAAVTAALVVEDLHSAKLHLDLRESVRRVDAGARDRLVDTDT